jgi:hypothetical protein
MLLLGLSSWLMLAWVKNNKYLQNNMNIILFTVFKGGRRRRRRRGLHQRVLLTKRRRMMMIDLTPTTKDIFYPFFIPTALLPLVRISMRFKCGK